MFKTVESPYWTSVLLSSSGQPLLDEGEHDVVIQSSVGVYQGDIRLLDFQSGRVYLTDQRIIYVHNEGKKTSMSIKLIDVEKVDYYGGFLKSSPKVIITMKTKDDFCLTDTIRKESILLAWVCPICYYTNELKTNNFEVERLERECDSLPVCSNCGVTSTWKTISQVIKNQNRKATDIYFTSSSHDNNRCPDCTFCNHPSMKNCEICGANLGVTNLAENKVNNRRSIKLNLGFDERLNDLELKTIKLSFRNGGAKTFYTNLNSTIKHAMWTYVQDSNGANKGAVEFNKKDIKDEAGIAFASTNTKKSVAGSSSKPSAYLRGIHGLATQSEQNNNEISMIMNNSIQNLDGLMSKAQQLIELSEKYRLVLHDNKLIDNTINKTFSTEVEPNGKINSLKNIVNRKSNTSHLMNFKKINSLEHLKNGKPTVNTKSKLSQEYIDELSRHISEFLTFYNVLEQNNGLITLNDLYMLYNKSRRVNLISPNELYDAVNRFKLLNLNFKISKVPLSLDNASDKSNQNLLIISKKNQTNSIARKITSYIEKNPGKTILQLQNTDFNMSYMILKMILDSLAHKGELVIDSTLEGTQYWPNKILESFINNKCDGAFDSNEELFSTASSSTYLSIVSI